MNTSGVVVLAVKQDVAISFVERHARSVDAFRKQPLVMIRIESSRAASCHRRRTLEREAPPTR